MGVSVGDLKLSAQRGLLGNVFQNLRAVCINANGDLVQIYFYHKNSISEKEQALCQDVLNQTRIDFAQNRKEKSQIKFETAIVHIDFPKKMPLIGHWVFYRQEDSSQYID